MSPSVQKSFFFVAVIFCLTPWCSPPVALLLGLLLALFIGNPYAQESKKYSGSLLRYSVIGLGFGMNFTAAMAAGKQGFMFTVASILGTLLLGALTGKLLGIDKKISHLISAGTAICGGSAIAAVSPVIDAKEEQMSVSLGIVFILNSVALFVFPVVGHWLAMSEQQFGLWSAIAIHDTSSVVGAASSYGKEALQVATTVKLARALWIIPVTLGSSLFFKSEKKGVKIPWFIGWFIVAMLVNTYVPAIQPYTKYVVMLAKTGLTATLFLIGSGLSKKAIQSVGFKPFAQGVFLWIVISLTSLYAVLHLIA